MENKTAQFVQGYWRNKEDKAEVTTKDGVPQTPVMVLLGAALVQLAIVFWYITIAIVIVTAATYAYRWNANRPAQQQELKINYYKG